MMDLRPLAGLALLLFLPPLHAQDRDSAQVSNPLEVHQELGDWRARNGATWRADLDPLTGFAGFLHGGTAAPVFEPGAEDADWFSVARVFAEETFALHGIESETLVEERLRMLPLGLVGGTDKMTMRFRQEVRGVPVFDARLNVLTNMAGNLLSVQTTALPGLASFPVTPTVDARRATATAVAAFVERVRHEPTSVSAAVLGIAGVERDEQRTAHLVYEVDVQWYESGSAPEGTTYRVDARSGAIVDQRTSVHYFDVGGTVATLATPGMLPDSGSNPPVQESVPFVRVQSSAGTVFADPNGVFNYPGVTGPLSCTFTFVGPYADVRNSSGATYSLGQNLTGTANQVLMNPSPTEQVTAQANAYTELVRLRNWIRSVNPTDDTADFAAVANCGVSGSCNAFFNGSSVNFYNSNSSCSNTAYSSVIAHEMGHWLNVLYGTNNGNDGMGEGNADVFAMYLYDDPIVGRNFTTSGGIIRTGTNNRQFCGDCCSACYGQVHTDGEVWMAAAWKVRTRLKNVHGTQHGGDIADALFLAWMNSYNQTQIKSVIETQWLTLDDDNGNIGDGTPNYASIDGGFREQGFPGVDLLSFSIDNVTVLANTQDEFGPYAVDARVIANLAPPVASVVLRYRVNNGPYVDIPMSPQGGDQFSALIPGAPSPTKISYYIAATDSNANPGVFPEGGAAAALSFFVGVLNTLYANNFEVADDQGWTHGTFGDTSNDHDDFQHGPVFGKNGDPGSAPSGTRVWGNDLGASGWNGLYQANQHNWLRSPSIPTDGAQITLLRFKRWLTVQQGSSDQALLKVNNLTVWSNNVSQNTVDEAWTEQEFDISSIATGSPTIQLEFSLNTSGSVNFGGWTLDDVEIVTVAQVNSCPPPINYGIAKINSLGWPATLAWEGATSVATNDFRITMVFGIPNQPGLLYSGTAPASVPFSGGLRLVASPITREAIFAFNSQGESSVPVPLTPAMVGTTRYYQKWYRDPADALGVGLSDGLQVFFCD